MGNNRSNPKVIGCAGGLGVILPLAPGFPLVGGVFGHSRKNCGLGVWKGSWWWWVVVPLSWLEVGRWVRFVEERHESSRRRCCRSRCRGDAERRVMEVARLRGPLMWKRLLLDEERGRDERCCSSFWISVDEGLRRMEIGTFCPGRPEWGSVAMRFWSDDVEGGNEGGKFSNWCKRMAWGRWMGRHDCPKVEE